MQERSRWPVIILFTLSFWVLWYSCINACAAIKMTWLGLLSIQVGTPFVGLHYDRLVHQNASCARQHATPLILSMPKQAGLISDTVDPLNLLTVQLKPSANGVCIKDVAA